METAVEKILIVGASIIAISVSAVIVSMCWVFGKVWAMRILFKNKGGDQ